MESFYFKKEFQGVASYIKCQNIKKDRVEAILNVYSNMEIGCDLDRSTSIGMGRMKTRL